MWLRIGGADRASGGGEVQALLQHEVLQLRGPGQTEGV